MPAAPKLYVLKLPEDLGQLIRETRYVGSIMDRPEAELRNARKFSTAAGAASYIESRPSLRGSVVEAVEEAPR